MKLTKNFNLEHFIPEECVEHYRDISKFVLEPIQQRFGQVLIKASWNPFDIQFKVKDFDSNTIYEYVQNNLVHSFVMIDLLTGWIIVRCEKEENNETDQ